MTLTDQEYTEAVESVEEIFKNTDRMAVQSLGYRGRKTGEIRVSYSSDTPSHMRFMSEVLLNELRRQGFVIINLDSSGIHVQVDECHNPDRYDFVFEGDR